MRCKEIMLGDWLSNDGEKFRVHSIGQHSVVFLDEKGVKNVAHEDFIEPIPLTKDMLEKNGFTYDPNSEEENDGWWHRRNFAVPSGNEYLSIAFRDDDVAVYDLNIMKGNNSGDFHLNYVHELQHLMNTLGFVTIEIKL